MLLLKNAAALGSLTAATKAAQHTQDTAAVTKARVCIAEDASVLITSRGMWISSTVAVALVIWRQCEGCSSCDWYSHGGQMRMWQAFGTLEDSCVDPAAAAVLCADGQQFMVDGQASLDNVPKALRAEVREQLLLMQRLATAALGVK